MGGYDKDKHKIKKGNSLSIGGIMVTEGQILKDDVLSKIPEGRIDELVTSGLLEVIKDKVEPKSDKIDDPKEQAEYKKSKKNK